MKNRTFSRMALMAGILITFLLSSTSTRAQNICSGYLVKNLTSCPVLIKCTVMCNGGGTCINTNFNIAANSSFNVPACQCQGGNCNTIIALLEINGTPLASPPAVSSAIPSGSYNAGICPSLGTINWFSTNTIIK